MWSVLLSSIMSLKALDTYYQRSCRGKWYLILMCVNMAALAFVLQGSRQFGKIRECEGENGWMYNFLNGSAVFALLALFFQFVVVMRYGSPREYLYYQHIVTQGKHFLKGDDDTEGSGVLMYKKHLPKRYKFDDDAEGMYHVTKFKVGDNPTSAVWNLEPCKRSIVGKTSRRFLVFFFVLDVAWFIYGCVVEIRATGLECQAAAPQLYWLVAALLLLSGLVLSLTVVVYVYLCMLNKTYQGVLSTVLRKTDELAKRSEERPHLLDPDEFEWID